jgi:hypothetical protein
MLMVMTVPGALIDSIEEARVSEEDDISTLKEIPEFMSSQPPMPFYIGDTLDFHAQYVTDLEADSDLAAF